MLNEAILKVVNINEPYDVYIGRNIVYGDNKWGNPFRIGQDGTRKEVIEKYRTWIWQQKDLLSEMLSLDGKTLGCHCKPKSCHGEVIIEVIESLKRELKIRHFSKRSII
jgi:hypothetical protein